MAVYPVDWSALASGGNAALCVLIAGYPHPIVAPGVSLTDVSWTSTADTAWHAGTSSITPKPWLDLPTEIDGEAPAIVLDERSSPVQQELQIAPIYLRFADPENSSTGNGSVTELLYSTRDQPITYLTSELAAGATTANVESTAAFASSGTLYIGREVMTYSGKTSTTFTGLTRGLYGTRDKLHALVSSMLRPQVYSNASGIVSLPSLKGRRITIWLLSFASASSTTAVDPALIYDGRAAAGTELSGAAIRVSVLHALKALETKLRPTSVLLNGYHHGGVPADSWAGSGTIPSSDGQLLAIYVEQSSGGSAGSNFTVSLTSSDDDSSTGTAGIAGWCATAGAFIARWNRRSAVVDGGGYTLNATLSGGKLLYTIANGTTTATHVHIAADWESPTIRTYPTTDPSDGADTPIFLRSIEDFPTAWINMNAPMRVSQTDAGQIPSPVTASGGTGVDAGSYVWALEAQRGSEILTAPIYSASAASDPGVIATTLDPPPRLPMDGILTEPTTAQLVARCTGNTWWGALRYGVIAAVDAWQGLDVVSDSFAWDRIRDVARGVGAALPLSRRYTIRGGDAIIDRLRDECAVNGLVLCTYRGRISVARIRDVSLTEPSSGEIVSADSALDMPPRMVEAVDGTASSFNLKLTGKRSIRVVDVVAEDESGGGREITADGSSIIQESVTALALVNAVTQQAMAVLGPFSRPYRVATVTTDLRFGGVQIGDVIYLTDWLLPNDNGSRGLSARPCMVLGRRVTLAATEGTRVELDLLMTGPDFAGYAPEVMVGSITGTTVTVDTTYLGTQGVYGFCDETLPSGAARADGGASFFSVDDAVALHELDATSPATPYTTSVASVSGTTIELAGSPGASWQTLASTAGKVLLAYDGYASAELSQRRYCYIATTAGAIGADSARRFAG